MTDSERYLFRPFGNAPDGLPRDLLQHAGPLLTALLRGHVPMLVCDARQPGLPVVFANPAFSRLTGYACEDIVGRNCRFLQGRQTDAGSIGAIRHALETRREIGLDLLNYRHDGSPFWNRLFIAPVFGAAGELLYFVSLHSDATWLQPPGETVGPRALDDAAWDIAAQRLAEETLREHRARMDALVNQAAVGIVQTDIDGKILMANRRFCELVGRPEDALLGLRLMHLSLPEDYELSRQRYQAMLETGEPYFIEKRYVRPDGTPVWVSCHVSLLRDDAGRPRCTSIVATDIGARKRGELRQTALFELGDKLRNLRDSRHIAAAAAQTLCRVMAVSRAGYGEVDAEQRAMLIEPGWMAGQPAPLAGRHRLADTPLLSSDLQRGTTVAIADVELDPRTAADSAGLRALGIRSMLYVPLLENGRLSAVLFLHHAVVRGWDPEELDFVRAVADRSWAAIRRAGADAALQRLNETLEQRVAERTADRDRIWRLSTDVMLTAAFDLTIQAANPAWKTAFDWYESELIGASLLDFVHPDDVALTRIEMRRLTLGQHSLRFEIRCRHRQGAYRWISWRAAADEAGIHAVGRDVTAEREAGEALRRAEEQLRQAQKMEAVGQLTGGIAHDFNNILQGVIGPLDLIRRSIELGRTANLGRFIDTAIAAAHRAAALTHRLLAFSRRQSLDPKPIDLGALVSSLEDLLRRTLGERIVLQTASQEGLWHALTDANQLENSVLNLVINARDAMPAGGRLTIATANVRAGSDPALRDDGIEAGDYVMLSVADTGTGMPPEVVEKAFDPFFTTKPIGQGTGLGLSMIYGFAKQSNGHVRIHSRVGVGTEVRLYLPRCEPEPPARPAEPPVVEAAAAQPQGAGETVLVVEDDPAVRMVVVEVLRGLGYATLEAADGAQGLAAIDAAPRVDLLVTDVGMPGINGRELASRARRLRPGLAVLFMTGYAENAQLRSGFLEPGMEMIIKPFAIDHLAATVREMLAHARG
ncbi:hypothetical protein GCM10023144_45900 [Pigmentiphaga soli]|uniref:histidine kinase n=1 Tax=Pigmentiphaga soli TaxID=1007095 RepID=A0ABP8HRI5_9BURK